MLQREKRVNVFTTILWFSFEYLSMKSIPFSVDYLILCITDENSKKRVNQLYMRL